MLKLYHHKMSTCSQKVRLALAEKRLGFEERLIALERDEQISDWYLKVNPNGVVPALDHDGNVVVDSSVINEYLEDVFPEMALRPRDALPCARMRAWRQFIDEVPTHAIRYPTFNRVIARNYANMTDEEFCRLAARRPLRKHLFLKMGRMGFSERDVANSLEQLEHTLRRMDQSLQQGPWLIGEMFTLADISVTPTIVRMEDLGLDHMWSGLPRVANWYQRVRARPSFAIAFMPGSRDILKYGQSQAQVGRSGG
jgi:glutathione S-transferase